VLLSSFFFLFSSSLVTSQQFTTFTSPTTITTIYTRPTYQTVTAEQTGWTSTATMAQGGCTTAIMQYTAATTQMAHIQVKPTGHVEFYVLSASQLGQWLGYLTANLVRSSNTISVPSMCSPIITGSTFHATVKGSSTFDVKLIGDSGYAFYFSASVPYGYAPTVIVSVNGSVENLITATQTLTLTNILDVPMTQQISQSQTDLGSKGLPSLTLPPDFGLIIAAIAAVVLAALTVFALIRSARGIPARRKRVKGVKERK